MSHADRSAMTYDLDMAGLRAAPLRHLAAGVTSPLAKGVLAVLQVRLTVKVPAPPPSFNFIPTGRAAVDPMFTQDSKAPTYT